jgi:hypothetical protein
MVVSCSRGAKPAAVTPADVPVLEQEARSRPGDGAVRFRLAAAYQVAGRCGEAAEQAGAGLQIQPDNVLGPLVIGGCQERDERYDLAAQTYAAFARHHPRARGIAALRAREQTALREGANLAARQALVREAELSALPPEPATVAVLPLTISGDTSFRALSRGLAELITTDLALIRSLRLLERLQVGALIDEMRLAEQGRVEAATAARMGRLLRAERLLQGTASVTSITDPVRLELAVIFSDGTVSAGPQVHGPFRNLLDLEKQLVIGLSQQLGIQLTQAERERILRHGPKSLAAFLAYSLAIDAMDRADYGAAASHFGAALRADPGFTAARQGQQAALATPVVQHAGAGSVLAVPEAVQHMTGSEPAAVTTGALESSIIDVASTMGDAGSTAGQSTVERQVTTETQGIANLQGVSAIIRFIFRRPL